MSTIDDSDESSTAPDELPSYVEDMIREWNDDADVLEAIGDFAAMLQGDADQEPLLAEDVDGEVAEVSVQGTLVKKKQKCGDESCKCASGDLHGPYLWDVHRDENGDRKWEYIGKPAGDADAPQ